MTRLDAALAKRGLARSRTHAASLISAGMVTVNGAPVVKASTNVGETATIAVAGADHYVSRGAHKLIAALDAFDVDVSERAALDLGASTGGFTQVLRERRAKPVYAIDVGHGQLAVSIREDPAVIAVEGFNVRHMSPQVLAEAAGAPVHPGVITGDLSFISLAHVLPAVRSVASDDTDIVLLIKPQFEVGRTGVREGVVRNVVLRLEAVNAVLWSAWDAGLGVHGLIASPLAGTHGNAEYLVHLRVREATGVADDSRDNPSAWLAKVEELVHQSQ